MQLQWQPDTQVKSGMIGRAENIAYVVERSYGEWSARRTGGGVDVIHIRDPFGRHLFKTRKAAVAACERHANPPPRPVATFTPTPRKVWLHKETGRKVSPHGACPWWNASERDQWELVEEGWTIRCDHPSRGTYYWSPRKLSPDDALSLADTLTRNQTWPIPV